MLDNFRKTRLVWDKASQKITEFIRAGSNDNHGRKLSVLVTDEGEVVDLSGLSLSLYWETADKSVKGLDALAPVNATEGKFEIYYTPELLSNVGHLRAHLVLVSVDGRVISEAFRISVFSGIDEGAIVGQASFTALTDALLNAQKLEENYAPRLNAVEINKADKTEVNNLTAQLAEKANQSSINDFNARVDKIITTPVGEISNQEIIDARDNEPSLGANIRRIKNAKSWVTIDNIFDDGEFKGVQKTWFTNGLSQIDLSKEGFIMGQTAEIYGIRFLHNFKKGHKYFVSFYFKHNRTTDASVGFRLYQSGNEFDYINSPLYKGFDTVPADVLQKNEAILTMDNDYDKMEIGSWPNTSYKAEIGFLKIIDLTELYGEGSEPELYNVSDTSPTLFDNKILMKDLKNKEIFKRTNALEKAVNSIEKHSDYLTVPEVNNVFNIDMATNQNFEINIIDEERKQLVFNGISDIKEPLISKTIKLNFKSGRYLSVPISVVWKDGAEPLFLQGYIYMLLIQSFDSGITWLGSIVGKWKITEFLALDNFERPNSNTLGGDWQYSPTSVWSITDKKAHVSTIRTDNSADPMDSAYLETGVSDCWVSSTFGNGLGHSNRVIVRLKDIENYITVGRFDAYIGIFSIQDGVQTILKLSATAVTQNVGDRLDVYLEGSRIKVFYNDLLAIDYSTSLNMAETKHGLSSYNTTARFFENFIVRSI